MATKAELEQSLTDPDMVNFLNLIYQSEGASYGYYTLFGNTKFDSLNQHPNIAVPFVDKTGKKDSSTAAGRYQFLYKTWNEIKSALNLNDFGAHSQDLGAAYLIDKKGALNDVLSGDFKTAINKLGGVWASLPSSQYKSTQNSRSWDFINNLPIFKAFSQGVATTGAVTTNPDGVGAGVKEVVSNSSLVDSAGNFLLRGVVIISAIIIIAIGFYFMFQQEINNTVNTLAK